MNYLDHICTDGTHKITYQGYPIILVRTTDLNRVFHPFGTMLTRYEKTKDFEFMFQTVKDLANKICSFIYDPRILVADNASAITKGFKKVFTLIKRVDFWSHVDRNIDKNLSKHVCIVSLI